MRSRIRKSAALSLVLAVTVALPASADFNPLGRGKKKAPSAPAAPRRAPNESTQPKERASSESPAGAAPAKEGDSAALIARYTALALARPGEAFPLERLVQLFRERDGSLDKLVADLRAHVEKGGADQYAARLALAGVLRHDGQLDAAASEYEHAISEAPDRPIAEIALARLLSDRGDKAGARKQYEHALPRVTVDADREQILRTLVGLSLDLDDFPAARKYHDEIVRRAKGSFFARAELGRELLQRGDNARAEAELRELTQQSAGDNRALAPALRDLGQALSRQGKTDEAVEVLRRALVAAGTQSGLRREILEVLIDVYRRRGGVAEVVALMEKEHPDDFERLVLLGGLYEETGRVSEALSAYERALSRKDDLATRMKVVQLLEVAGKLDEAVKQYERLIRSSPRDPELVFHFAEALIQRGDRARALLELSRLEARAGGDVDTLTALAQFYEKIEEAPRAAQILDRLAKSGGTDPRHLVDLGDYYYRQGDTKKALDAWERIRLVVPDRARALHALGEVLLEHDMADKALAALKQAAELVPREPKYRKALALALERSGSGSAAFDRKAAQEGALEIWEKLLRDAGSDRTLAREARQHIVSLWGLEGQLGDRVKPLERRLSQSPPDLDAGRLLAEVYVRLRRPADAERVLTAIVKAAPGDTEAQLALERALVAQKKRARAIEVLGALAKIDPRRAREYYERMAQYSAELYRDDDAIRYAARAVELNPDDAEGHRKLGEMYRRRQDVQRAASELRLALSKNDRLFPVYFDLAELLLSQNQPDEADRLLRRVMHIAPDDDLVARAARVSMQLNLGRGTVESLERELLPLSLGNPMRPIFRRLLVEVYGNMAFPLVHEARSGDPARASRARAELAKIGDRAVKPLLDALGDDRDAQQRTAIDLLSHVENRTAGPALIAFATGKADGELRTRAMIAVGALADPSLLPKLRSVLAPSGDVRVDETDTVAIAAAWAVARMRSPRARPLLAQMLSSDAPSVRALAAVGLGLLASRSDARALSDMASAAEEHPVARAAAVFALGAVGGDRASDLVRHLSDAPDPLLRGVSVVSLARLTAKDADRAASAALIAEDTEVREAGLAAALVLTTKEYRAPTDALPIPEGRVDVRHTVSALLPSGYTADEKARALSLLAPSLVEVAIARMHASPESARTVAAALLARGNGLAFSPLTDDLDSASPEARKACDVALERIARGLVEPFVALSKHPVAEVRVRAVRVLSLRSEPEARAAIAQAISDPDPLVQQTALSSLVPPCDPQALASVTALARSGESWAVRARAVEALSLLSKKGAEESVVPVLAEVALHDSVDFVREAAVRGLGTSGTPSSREALQRVVSKDPEPRIRDLAKGLLQGTR